LYRPRVPPGCRGAGAFGNMGPRNAPAKERSRRMPTPSIEDYLERIYELVEEKGYARVSDIASSLDVQPSSVTRMLQRLDDQEFLVYEKYRGLVLTAKGQELGRRIKERHQLLEDFLRLLGVNEEDVQRDVEGIE